MVSHLLKFSLISPSTFTTLQFLCVCMHAASSKAQCSRLRMQGSDGLGTKLSWPVN